MRKFLAPRNSTTAILPASPAGSPLPSPSCAGKDDDGGLDDEPAVVEDDEVEHATTAPPPCRRPDDSNGRRRPRRRLPPLAAAAPKPGRAARERFTHELPMARARAAAKEMQVRARWCKRVNKRTLSLARAPAVAVAAG